MEVYLGIDWSEAKHDACFVNAAGAALSRLTFPHSPAGLSQLDAARAQLGVSAADCVTGLETAHTLLIDHLWAHGYVRVYVVPPGAVKAARPRFSASGARTDQRDAYVLADLVRTDRGRWAPWQPDGALTRQLRAQVTWRLQAMRTALGLSNQLRAVLLRYYPAALAVFSALAQPLTLHFVLDYPTPAQAAALGWEDFRAFARRHGYPHPARLAARFARLQAPQPAPEAATVLAFAGVAREMARALLGQLDSQRTAERAVAELFAQHPDRALFASLPGAGAALAPGLLVKFGDDRRRFPTAGAVQALAGTCPVTEQSGKHQVVKFRRACDHDFRFIAQEWARCSLKESPWAAAYWERVRPHCGSDNHATRCLANRWLAVAWAVWQAGRPYDEAYHLQQCAARAKPRA